MKYCSLISFIVISRSMYISFFSYSACRECYYIVVDLCIFGNSIFRLLLLSFLGVIIIKEFVGLGG